MPTVVLENPAFQEPQRKRWTRSECLALKTSGFWDYQYIELIDGELIRKMQNRPHVNTLSLVFAWLIGVFGKDYVNPEAPIDVSPEDNPTNMPEPDLIVLARPMQEIRTGNVQPSDLRLLIEVSDTTPHFDMRVKAPLYARAGIVEYWIADIAARRIIVHRDAQNGEYRTVEAYSAEESVSPLAAPEHALAVSSVFPE